jgi:putative inorganic carbon (hco3(-)) transporter
LRFALFVLVNAMLYIRPAEFHPALLELPVYEVCILACLTASYPALLALMSPSALAERPIVACAVGMLAAIVMSHLSNVEPARALEQGIEFAKLLLYLFLLVAVVDTLRRLEWLLGWLATFALAITGLAVLHYHGIITVPSLTFVQTDSDGSGSAEGMIKRLGSTGLFQDPNDMCLMLVMAMMICLYQIIERRRVYWLAPLVLFGHALTLTHSRGGFMGMLVALIVLMAARFGKRAAPLGVLVLPVVFVLFAGRQTSLGSGFRGKGTGATRLQLWAEGLQYFVRHPLFGIGGERFDEYMDHVAHNSFIHCYTELGMFGGTFFLGAFYLALWTLVRLGGKGVPPLAPELERLRPYVMAIVAGYGAGLLSLSCAYMIPTYTVLGLSAVFTRLAEVDLGVPVARWNGRLVRRLVAISLGFIVVAQVGVRLLVRI